MTCIVWFWPIYSIKPNCTIDREDRTIGIHTMRIYTLRIRTMRIRTMLGLALHTIVETFLEVFEPLLYIFLQYSQFLAQS